MLALLLGGCMSVPAKQALPKSLPPEVSALKLRVGTIEYLKWAPDDLVEPMREALTNDLSNAGLLSEDPDEANAVISVTLAVSGLSPYQSILTLSAEDRTPVERVEFTGGTIGQTYDAADYRKVAGGISSNLIAKLLASQKVAAFARAPRKKTARVMLTEAQATENSGNLPQALAAYQTTAAASRPGGRVEKVAYAGVIRIVGKMETSPPVSADAKRLLVRGGLLFKDAKDKVGFQDAITELNGAVRLAPWWPEAHFNLGLAFEAAERWADAAAEFKLYAAASPGARDLSEVQTKIIELELHAERESP